MRYFLLLIAIACFPATASTVIASLGDVTVTDEEFEAEMLRIPAESRAEFRASVPRIAKFVENLLVTKVLAAGARKSGIDQDRLARREMELSAEKVLARRERERLEAAIKVPDLGKRAEEVYKANRGRYAVQPTYRTQHILVDIRCRTREAALARATEARKEIVAGLAFADAVAKYSDDPSAPTNKGDIGFMTIDRVAAEYGEVMEKLKPGELSQPVLTQYGWHLIKLVDSTPRAPYRFEEVRESILAELRQEYIRTKSNEITANIRTDPAIKVNTEALDSLKALVGPAAIPVTPR